MEHNSRLVSRGGCQPAVFVSAGPAWTIFFFRNGFHPPCLFNGACQGRFAPPGTGCFCRRAKDSSSPHCHRRTGSTPIFFSSCRRMGKFRTPGAGCFWHAFARGRFAPPGARPFWHGPKGPKRPLRGSTPKYPSFGIRVVEGFILQTVSVERLPTYPGTLQ